jgi:glycerophosphoryl diester phosphodiesterase
MTAHAARWHRRSDWPPLVLGHRGASAHAVENTLEAFARAIADGADGVELDVQRCATGEAVVFHDLDLMRLAGRRGRVAELGIAELGAVRLHGGGRIPTLREALEAVGTALVNVELKVPDQLRAPPGLVAAALAAIDDARASERVLVSSFHPGALAELRWRAPDIPIGFLFHARERLPLRRAWPARWLAATAVHPEHAMITPPAMRRWRRAGYAVNAWTVDGAAAVVNALRLGVDAVITNDPAATIAHLVSARSTHGARLAPA